jgi:DNA-binding NarL/FixJ family response regulator
MLRVILSESRPMLRQGFLSILERDDGVGVLATAATLAEALALDERHAPDVHLIGARLPPAGGLAATQLLVRRRPDAAVIIVAEGGPDGRERADEACRALVAGASGYLERDAEPAETLRAVREVAAGRLHLSGPSWAAVRATVRRLAARQAALTPGQTITLELVGRGLSTKEIAAIRGVSPSTVKRDIRELEAIFGVRGRTLLAIHAVAAAPPPVPLERGERPYA